MNSFQKNLDKYLTEPTDDGFESWAEALIEALEFKFYANNQSWIDENNGAFNRWLNKLFYKSDLTINQCAKLIERAHKLYLKKH